jgi:hypothetical protein
MRSRLPKGRVPSISEEVLDLYERGRQLQRQRRTEDRRHGGFEEFLRIERRLAKLLDTDPFCEFGVLSATLPKPYWHNPYAESWGRARDLRLQIEAVLRDRHRSQTATHAPEGGEG